MRTLKIELPPELMKEFTKKLTELELENSIVGRNDDDEIIIEVYYEKSESEEVDELEEFVEELKQEYYDQLEGEDEEDN